VLWKDEKGRQGSEGWSGRVWWSSVGLVILGKGRPLSTDSACDTCTYVCVYACERGLWPWPCEWKREKNV
jgi:hypothetical protein